MPRGVYERKTGFISPMKGKNHSASSKAKMRLALHKDCHFHIHQMERLNNKVHSYG